jgi:hypothetical protein
LARTASGKTQGVKMRKLANTRKSSRHKSALSKTQVWLQVLSAGSDVPEGTNLNLQPTTSPLFHFHALVGVLHVLDYSEYNCFTKTILILRFYYHLWDP